jgi:PKD repeat protein
MAVPNKPINFTDTSTGRVSVSWDFGDGTPPETGNPVSHTYAAAGTYRVTDTITSSTGETKTCFQDIAVSSIPPSNNAGIIGVAAVGITIAVIAYLLTRKETPTYQRTGIGVKA